MAAQAKKIFLVETSMLLGCTCGKHQRKAPAVLSTAAVLVVPSFCNTAAAAGNLGLPAEVRLGIPRGFLWGMA